MPMCPILLTQQNQIGQMAGWLSTWGLPAAASDAPMAWIAGGEHAHTAGAADPDAPAGYAAMPSRASWCASTGSAPRI